jgi:hypothetical protein
VRAQLAAIKALLPDDALQRLEGCDLAILIHPSQQQLDDLRRTQWRIAFDPAYFVEDVANFCRMVTHVGRNVLARERK